MPKPTPTQLRIEYETDPAELGYATADVPEALMNIPNETLHGTVDVLAISPVDLQAVVVGSEFLALSAAAQRAWLALVGLVEVPVANENLRQQIADIWELGTTTRTNLQALQTRPASRAEKLWGVDVVITHKDLLEAIRS